MSTLSSIDDLTHPGLLITRNNNLRKLKDQNIDVINTRELLSHIYFKNELGNTEKVLASTGVLYGGNNANRMCVSYKF